MLSAQGLATLEAVMKRYPTKQAAIRPLFHLVQKEHGYISAKAEEWIASKLDLPPVKVHEVMTFYTMLHAEPVGRHHLQLCRTLPCMLRGSERLLAHLKGKLGLIAGERTADGRFSLQEVECLAACGNAPCIQVNDDYHMDVTVEKLDRLLDSLK